jgi:multidrug resistance efflux pump
MSASESKTQIFLKGLLFFLFMFILLSACSAAPDTLSNQPSPALERLDEEVSASGEVVPEKWTTLSYPGGVEDLEVFVSEGDQVSRNEILVTTNDSRLQASLYQAMSVLERAQLAYNQVMDTPSELAVASADAAYKNALAYLIRQEDLNADESVIEAAQADVDAAFANLEVVVAGATDEERAAVEYDLSAAQLTLEKAENAFDLRAPFAGQVVEIYVQSGEAIGAMQPVLILADLSRFQVVTTDLSEVDVARLEEGQKASIVFDAIPNQTFEGIVEKIADKSSGVSSVYYEVTLSVNNVPDDLRWGMTAFIVFPVD